MNPPIRQAKDICSLLFVRHPVYLITDFLAVNGDRPIQGEHFGFFPAVKITELQPCKHEASNVTRKRLM